MTFLKFLIVLLLSYYSFSWAKDLPLDKLKLPPGFKISVLADVPGARSMTIAPDGRIFVGTQDSSVYVVENGKSKIFAKNLDTPNGVAYHDGKLYVAEISRILVFDADPKQKLPIKKYTVLPQKFPSDQHHGWKFIRFGPDGKLYVPVGANCNVCDPKIDYARIYRIDVNGSNKEEIASGIRNTVGFDFDPDSKTLWFTDNGRDMLGDDVPPDELNHLTKLGQNFGFPICFGNSVSDPEFGKQKPCSQTTPPALELRAHVAAIGMRFYTGKMFPPEYQNNIFIAEHGSWNRTIPQGYRITFVPHSGNTAIKVESFIEGWLQDKDAWGRPVDVEIQKDGSLLISDDKAGVIYKVIYSAGK